MIGKELNNNTNYGISKTELVLIEKLKKESIITFSSKEISRLLGFSRIKSNNLLQNLIKKGFVKQLKREKYALTKFLKSNSFQIATEAINPSYISFWSALSYYGFTTQQVANIILCTTKQQKIIDLGFCRTILVKVSPGKFFGYTKIEGFNIASKEKCLIDSLAYPGYSGGFREVVDCIINSWESINKKIFIRYLKKYNNKSLNARFGYILEKNGLMEVKLPIQNNYIRLNREKKISDNINKKWRLIINDNI